MKKMMLGMLALCAATAFGDMKIGTVDMMVLVRNHKSYDTNKKMLQDSEKDYQRELDQVKSELDVISLKRTAEDLGELTCLHPSPCPWRT